jgi:hypothetical protein
MASKRQKTDDGAGSSAAAAGGGAAAGDGEHPDLSGPIIHPDVFAPTQLAAAKASYAAAEPFRHGVVAPLCNDACMRAVQTEMRTHLTATFKETDLFKVVSGHRQRLLATHFARHCTRPPLHSPPHLSPASHSPPPPLPCYTLLPRSHL